MEFFIYLFTGWMLYQVYDSYQELQKSKRLFERSKRQLAKLQKWEVKFNMIETMNRFDITFDRDELRNLRRTYDLETLLDRKSF